MKICVSSSQLRIIQERVNVAIREGIQSMRESMYYEELVSNPSISLRRGDLCLQNVSALTEDLIKLLVQVKHVRNEYNAHTTLPCGLTIDEALVEMPVRNTIIEEYSRLRSAKEMRSRDMSNAPSIMRLNYSTEDADKLYKAGYSRINQIQLQLDAANSEPCIEVDVDSDVMHRLDLDWLLGESAVPQQLTFFESATA